MNDMQTGEMGLVRSLKLEARRLFLILILLSAFSLQLSAKQAYAAVDNTAHWPVEVTLSWNSVYGTVSGLALAKGDSVGMFDSEGNCYGAGVFDGSSYYLSAFAWEEKDPSVPNDFTIAGFQDGEKVIFKVYRENAGQEYIVTPSSSESYIYTYQGIYPPERIDLVYYKEPEPLPEGPGPQERAEEPEQPTTPEEPTPGYWRVGPLGEVRPRDEQPPKAPQERKGPKTEEVSRPIAEEEPTPSKEQPFNPAVKYGARVEQSALAQAQTSSSLPGAASEGKATKAQSTLGKAGQKGQLLIKFILSLIILTLLLLVLKKSAQKIITKRRING